MNKNNIKPRRLTSIDVERDYIKDKYTPTPVNSNREYKYGLPITNGMAPKNVKLAMDEALTQANWFKSIQYMLDEQDVCPQFLGYQYLSSLCQNGLIKAGVDVIASEMTRKFVNIENISQNDLSQKIKEIEDWLEKFNIKSKFHKAVELTKYFGGCFLYIDTGVVDPNELKKPLIIHKSKIKQGQFKGLIPIEPILVSPGLYNASNPLREDYFNPETFYIQGIEVHKSRFLYFSDNEPTLLLKPVYNFFGVPTSQIVIEYVNNYLKNRDSATRLLNKFSLTVFKSDLSNWLDGGDGKYLGKRLDELAKGRTNDAVYLIDKESEDIAQINTPLQGVKDILENSLDLIPIMFRIPKMKFLQLQQAGMNNGSTEYQNFNDFIIGEKEKLFRNNLEILLHICQLDLYGVIDNGITFNFDNIKELDDREKAEVNRIKSEVDSRYIDDGVIKPQEVRAKLADDKTSEFDNINVSEGNINGLNNVNII